MGNWKDACPALRALGTLGDDIDDWGKNMTDELKERLRQACPALRALVESNAFEATGSGTLAKPVFTPAAGSVKVGTDVEIEAEEGADIYYTVNDWVAIAKYSAAIKISANTTIKAFAVKGGMASEKETAAYTAVPLSTEAKLLDFSFLKIDNSELDDDVDGVVDEGAKTVAIEVPNGTDVDALIPTITISDYATVDPDSGEAKDFTSPVAYTVTAENGTMHQEYTVTVTIAGS